MKINSIPDRLIERFEYKDGALYYVNGRKKGQVAGFKHKCRTCYYWCVKYKRQRYQAHRVIWTMFNGPIPEGLQIDHINGDSLDNRIENLRLVTAEQNQKNTKLLVNNTTGISGVNWNKQRNKYQARINTKGNRINLGWFEDFFEACCARKRAENIDGLYTERNGRAV